MATQAPPAQPAFDIATAMTPIPTNVSMNIIDLIILDHNCVRALYTAFASPAVTLEQRQMLAWQLVSEISQHAAKEEMVLYPVIRSLLGEDVAAACLSEHQLVKAELLAVDASTVTLPGYVETLAQTMQDLLAHIIKEERELLPKLRSMLTLENQLQLGIQFESAKSRAPTRPHPADPNMPPYNEAANAIAKQLDLSADQSRLPSVVPVLVVPAPTTPTAPPQYVPGSKSAAQGSDGAKEEGPTSTDTGRTDGDGGTLGTDTSEQTPELEEDSAVREAMKTDLVEEALMAD